jgi:hypothetical protein
LGGAVVSNWTLPFIESQIAATIESLTPLLFPERTGVSIRRLVSSKPRRMRFLLQEFSCELSAVIGHVVN